jgi:hypothetical protein
MLFIIPCVNNDEPLESPNAAANENKFAALAEGWGRGLRGSWWRRRRRRRRGMRVGGWEGGREGWLVAAISHSRDLYQRGRRPVEVKFSN